MQGLALILTVTLTLTMTLTLTQPLFVNLTLPFLTLPLSLDEMKHLGLLNGGQKADFVKAARSLFGTLSWLQSGSEIVLGMVIV